MIDFNSSIASKFTKLVVSRVPLAASAASSDVIIYGVTDTTAARTITISTADTVDGRIFIIKDESGGALTNNITIATDASQTIDGQSTIAIVVDYGVMRLYSDGDNFFSW